MGRGHQIQLSVGQPADADHFAAAFRTGRPAPQRPVPRLSARPRQPEYRRQRPLFRPATAGPGLPPLSGTGTAERPAGRLDLHRLLSPPTGNPDPRRAHHPFPRDRRGDGGFEPGGQQGGRMRQPADDGHRLVLRRRRFAFWRSGLGADRPRRRLVPAVRLVSELGCPADRPPGRRGRRAVQRRRNRRHTGR